MRNSLESLPFVRSLPSEFSLSDAFLRLAGRPGCLWLDSASRGPIASPAGGPHPPTAQVGRYSFLMADPLDRLEAWIDDCDPWPKMAEWCRALPTTHDPSLPPFQGGIAGLIGYEAATWLEPVGSARQNDLPTPAISLGLYDWTIATDHQTNQSWLLSQGIGGDDPQDRLRLATQRAEAVLSLLSGDSVLESTLAPTHENISGQHVTQHSGVLSNFTSQQFRDSVDQIVRLIHEGDSFQVNLAQRLLAKATCSSPQFYLSLRAANPAPFGAYYGDGDFQVLSSSPEGFLRVRQRHVETRPIKGTVPRTHDPVQDQILAEQLLASEKDRAENIMIVDLMRNDLSRVCLDNSVQVTQLCEIERYEYVQHLVSVVEGELAAEKTIVDLLRACFPGGSVTGAPKIEAMRTIARLEPNPRGPYCGSIGYIGCGGTADFSILIRTITAAHGYWQIPVGGGITARSQPSVEEAETWAKAEGMLRALP
jgi:para-aminobenzoate synthetase component I